MGFAGFDDMSSCLRTMTEEEGHEQDAAERICGALQEEAKADNGNVDELREALERGRGLIADVGVELNSAVDRPAIDSKWTMFKSVDADGGDDHDTQIDAPIVLKQDGDTEKRIAYAPAMIPREVDKEGDVVPTATVEQAAHDYLKQGGGVDSDHDLIDGKGEPVESWIEPEERTWDLPDGSTETYPSGTWMVGIEWDAETWDRIQSGELEGLSIYGKADHIPLQKSAGEDATAKAFEVPFAAEGVVHVVYESESLAERAADELGLDGATHEHDLDGATVHMPGEDHDAFVEAYMDETDAEDAVEASAEGDDAGESDGATPKSGDGATTKQDSSMSDTDTEDRVDKIDSKVSSLEEAVESIKDAVDTDKQPGDGDGDAGAVLRDLAAELANRDEVAANTDEIMTELKSSFLSEKEDDDEMDEEHEEEYDDKGEGDDGDAAAETAKADDGEPKFKGSDGSESAAVAKDAGGSTSGLPSYAATIEEDT